MSLLRLSTGMYIDLNRLNAVGEIKRVGTYGDKGFEMYFQLTEKPITYMPNLNYSDYIDSGEEEKSFNDKLREQTELDRILILNEWHKLKEK